MTTGFAEIERLIRGQLAVTLPDLDIAGMEISDYDMDGEPILFVNVLFRNPPASVDRRAFIQAFYPVREELRRHAETRVPVLKFYPLRDAA